MVMYDAESEFKNSRFVFNLPKAESFLGLAQWTYHTKLGECHVEVTVDEGTWAWAVAEKLDSRSEMIRTLVILNAPNAYAGLTSLSAKLALIESRVFIKADSVKDDNIENDGFSELDVSVI